MDAKISISLSINNLQYLLRDEATTKNPRLKKKVQKSIDNLCALKQMLKDVDDLAEATSAGPVNYRISSTVRLLKEVHSMEDATDTFVMTKEYSQQVQKKEQEDGKFSSSLAMLMSCCCWSCCCCGCCCCCCLTLNRFTNVMKYYCKQVFFVHKLKSLHSSILFTRKMNRFNEEVRHLVEMKGPVTSDIENNKNDTWLLSLRQRQHWERISHFCLEKETRVLIDLQQKLTELLLCSNVEKISEEKPEELNNSTDVVSNGEISAQVIALVGEGGSGKSTLARTVYNSNDVKKHFTKQAWVRIPTVFNARDVLLDVLRQINQAELIVDAATLSEGALMRRVTKTLNGKRFLIVLDDVDMSNVWESLRDALSSSSHRGVKVVIIARNKDYLPPCAAADPTINMCQLNDEESWKLFSKKVRIAEDELINSELITFKERILNLCGGLPSTIVLLGGLLSTKSKSCNEWGRVVSLLADKTSVDVMRFSYQELPSEVKLCFLYLGLFPRGFEIPVKKLIHLWHAEGFVTTSSPPDIEELDPEDVAEMCMEELVLRNMVEVKWRLDGRPKTCCMPNVLYDFFSSMAANAGFLSHQDRPSSNASPKYKKFAVRRLAANMGINHYSTPIHGCLRHLRSYVAFDNRVRITPARDMLFNKIISGGFALLRVLDLEGVFKPMLTDEVLVKLLLLRYLGLRSTFMDNLSDSVGSLPFLETLDVKNTNIQFIKLPQENKLQHVYLDFMREYHSITFQPNLLTLWGLRIHSLNFSHDSVLLRMRKLKKLGMTLFTFRQDVEASVHVAEWIDQLVELHSLKLRSIVDPTGPDYNDLNPSKIKLLSMNKHQKLQELYLLGILPELFITDPVVYFPPNLRKLTLSLSRLKADPMRALGKLPHLNILKLCAGSYKGEEMTCLSKGFPKLKLLKLWKLRVKEWTVEEGTMPCLRELEIRSCENLELPKGLHSVTTLQELVLTNMPTKFGEAVEESLKDGQVFIRNNTWKSRPFPY